MKKFKIEIILMGVLAMMFASCSDFFEPNYDTTLNVIDISRKAASFIPVFWVLSQRYKLLETKLFI